MLLDEPALPRGACPRKKTPERVGVTSFDRPARLLEGILVIVESGEQRIAIGHADVCPHLGRAACDPHRVPQPSRRKSEYPLGVTPLGERVDKRKCDDMRQVARGSKNSIVLRCIESQHARAT